MQQPANTGNNRPQISRWPWFFAVAVAVAGVLLSILLWQARRNTDRQALNDAFANDAQNLEDMVVHEIRLFMDVLDSIRQLHTISDQISAQDFSEFVSKGMLYQQQILLGFGFAQGMNDFMRAALEAAPDTDTGRGFRIVERSSDGTLEPALQKPVYYALTYQFPESALGVPVGFDFDSEPACREAVLRMNTTGEMAFGGRLPGGAAGTSMQFYVFAPILYPMVQGIAVSPPGALVGFAVGLFDPANILSRVAEVSKARGLRIELIPPDAEEESAKYSPPNLVRTGLVPVADRTWRIRCAAAPDYAMLHGLHRNLYILAAGLAITGLLTFELLLMAGRSRRIERTVYARTAALQKAKSMLEEEMAQRLRLENEILEISSREKLRVGQDLHDSLGQKLTGAVFLGRALTERLGSTGSEERESAANITELLKESVSQVRRIARGLAPVELGDEGLANALRRLAEDARELYSIPCEFRAEGDPAIRDGKTAIHLYHIAQEAVNNAARHSKASVITISLAAESVGGRLSIADNGSGLPPETARGHGMGLQIMKYRAQMIGGSLEAKSRTGGGTEVVCRFG